ncbi:MAG: hypothetical protein DHS20C21_11110 [Gemmatimonadota bacterium]|nr:MAG: hypothetical protein DHS20C21_11110 [Gemmatimonadota bacterium]
MLASGADAAPTFTRVLTGDAATDAQRSFGATWFDHDGDGDQDLFVVNLGQNNRLYRNDGGGLFPRLPAPPLDSNGGDSFAVAPADWNGDGLLDLYVANFGQQNFLYRNDGAGAHVRITTGAIATDAANSNGCAWLDFDSDGDLDQYVVNGGGQNNALYRNDGSTFAKLTGNPATSDGADAHGVSVADWDDDGDPDLCVPTNGGGVDLMFRNDGGGAFVSLTGSAVATDPGTAIGASFGDIDNDGDLDLFVSEALNGNNRLYRNDGGTFALLSTSVVSTDGGASMGSAFADADNDGDLDLYVANTSDTANFFYENSGNGTFVRVTTGDPATDTHSSRAVTWADADDDGHLDLLVTSGFGADDRNALYLNDGNANGRILIRCAIGARVRVHATIGGAPTWQMREIAQQSGGYGQTPLGAWFGLGTATQADSVQIRWADGTVQDVGPLDPGVYEIAQGGSPTGAPLSPGEAGPVRLGQNTPNPFSGTTRIPFRLSRAGQVRLEIFDVAGRRLHVLANDRFSAGEHSVEWTPRNSRDTVLFYRLSVDGVAATRRMALLRR